MRQWREKRRGGKHGAKDALDGDISCLAGERGQVSTNVSVTDIERDANKKSNEPETERETETHPTALRAMSRKLQSELSRILPQTTRRI